MLETVDWRTLLSGAIALLSLVLCTTLVLNLRFGMWKGNWFTRFGALLFLCLILFSAASLLEQMVEGKPGNTARFLMQTACVLDYYLSGMMAFAFSGLLFSIVDPHNQKRTVRWALYLLAALHTVLLLVAIPTNLYYVIDAQNRYQRSAGYGFAVIPPGLMLMLDVWILLHSKNQTSKKDRFELWTILTIPFADVILQLFLQDVTPVAVVAAALLLYALLDKKQIRELYRQQEENLRLRTEILLSEIQPHFMYNTLGAVAELCDSDPARAKQTTMIFSRYLQGVMGALSTPIVPFDRELEQLRLFLELEQVRFEEALQVEYQIECSDFELPSMCLQPLVENAIRHGIRRNKGGRGKLILRSEEREDCYIVSISDDGPGLEALKRPEQERVRVGLANVRERLRLNCGGNLELCSEAGKGTAATVSIPKKREE